MREHRMTLVACFAIAACGAGELVDRRGSIVLRDSLVFLEVPAEFRVGVPDTVTIATFGNSCISFARTEVVVSELQATVEPFDFDRGLTEFDESTPLSDLVVCNDNFVRVSHPAELIFDRTGEATIWFIGLHEWADTIGWHDSVVFVPRSVSVR